MDILAYLPAVLLALAVGAGGVGALWWADRSRRHRTPETEAGVLDRNGIEVLGVLASTVILLDTDDDVVRATSEAYSYGLVRNDSLVHDELKSMVRKVREDGRTRERQFIVSRSALTTTLPQLDCAVEYIRRQNGEDVVYRRGPIDLHQEYFSSTPAQSERHGTQPASSETPDQVFRGGLLVRHGRVGPGHGRRDNGLFAAVAGG